MRRPSAKLKMAGSGMTYQRLEPCGADYFSYAYGEIEAAESLTCAH
jgi:hypothetical protein